MRRFRQALLGLAFVAGTAAAGVYPPTTAKLPLPPLEVVGIDGRVAPLAAELRGAPGPVFLVPGYATCHGACPLLVRDLRKALEATKAARGDLPHRVLFLSFAGDSPETLRSFREREALPEEWRLVSVRTLAEAKRFLDGYGYLVEQRAGEYVHPSQIFVLDREGNWAASLFVREGLDRRSLERALAMTRDEAVSSPAGRWIEALRQPNRLLALGLCGLALSLGAIAWTLVAAWRRRRAAPTAT